MESADDHIVGTHVAAAVAVGIDALLVDAPDAAGAGDLVLVGAAVADIADSAAMAAYSESRGVETVHRWVHFGIDFYPDAGALEWDPWIPSSGYQLDTSGSPGQFFLPLPVRKTKCSCCHIHFDSFDHSMYPYWRWCHRHDSSVDGECACLPQSDVEAEGSHQEAGYSCEKSSKAR